MMAAGNYRRCGGPRLSRMGGSCLDVVLWSLSSLRIFTTIYNLSPRRGAGPGSVRQCPRSGLNINIMIHKARNKAQVGKGG